MAGKKISGFKMNVINLILALVVVIAGFYAFNLFNTPMENWFYLIIFFLILIYLEVLGKK